MKKELLFGFSLLISFFGLNAQQSISAARKKEISEPIAKAVKKLESKAPRLLESVECKTGELCIPYKKYQLSNGLKVIIHEDHSDPIVYVDVTYHVGSAREQQGRSGFAHFFEHMMFQGSKNVGDEMHFKYVTEAGGELNGTTNTDRTNYFETLPSNQLELALWLEADRMGFLLDSVTQQKFEIQRATVKNERGQRYDNAPYGLVYEKTGEALYPQGHPYSWQTIGYIEDLNRVDVNDLKRFYLRWYGPNNATLTIAGDVKTSDALLMAERYFGSIPVGPEVKAMEKTPGIVTENRFISYEDNIKFPMLKLSWPAAAAYQEDDAALDVLAGLLSRGKLSPLYTGLLKTQKASSADASNNSRELAGQFEITVRANKDGNLAELNKEIQSILEAWENKGISTEEIEKYKASFKSSMINFIATVRGKGSMLASYETILGNANQLDFEVNRHLKVTAADVQRVYQKYIKGKPAVILSVVPKGKTELTAGKDNWTLPARKIETESEEYKNLKERPETVVSFDRSKKPIPSREVETKIPTCYKEKLKNGIRVVGSENNEIPKINLQINIGAGHRFEPVEKSGLAVLTADLLNESTLLHSAEEMGSLLEKMGSNIYFSANYTDISMNISCLKEKFSETMDLAFEMLLKPKFDSSEFVKSKKKILDQIAQRSSQPEAMADQAYMRLLYGKGHIMGEPLSGTAESVTGLSLNDIKDYYSTQFSPSISSIVVAGAVKKEQLMAKLDYLNKWPNKKVVRQKEPSLPVVEKTKIYFIDKKAAPQSAIRMGHMAMAFDAGGEYFKSTVMNFPLGGSFNSLLNQTLREKKGFTYGSRSNFSGNVFDGFFTFGGAFKGNATDSSIRIALDILKNYKNNGMNQDELDFTKKSLKQQQALAFESNNERMSFMKKMLDYNLESDYMKKQEGILSGLTLQDLNFLAGQKIKLDNMIIVVVGDKTDNYEKIKALGLEVIELDLNGNPLR